MRGAGFRRPPQVGGSKDAPECAAALVGQAALIVRATASLIRTDARFIDAIRELYRAECRLDDAARILLREFLRRALSGEPADVEGALDALQTVASWRAPAQWRAE